VRYIHTIVHRALRDAVKWGRLVLNPADAADPPRARDAAESAPAMLTWEGAQLATFLRWSKDDRYGPAFHFLATSGMRRGEALGLRWADVDLDSAKVAIRRTLIVVGHDVTYGHTKTGRSRVVELDAPTVAVLRSHWARQAQDRLLLGVGYQDEDLVFCHHDGRPYHPERFSREFDRKLERYNRENPKAPLPRLRLHDLRHTWATLALQAGVHPKVVAERLGHVSTNVTLNTYSHVVQGMQGKAAEDVAALIFGSTS
jgi:integrase